MTLVEISEADNDLRIAVTLLTSLPLTDLTSIETRRVAMERLARLARVLAHVHAQSVAQAAASELNRLASERSSDLQP
ncbi:MAG TPA: hypothetical protein VIJ79_05065 [Acidobacteriaceae bacterium]